MIILTVNWLLVFAIFWTYHRGLHAPAEKQLSFFGGWTRLLLASLLSVRIGILIVTWPYRLLWHSWQVALLFAILIIIELSFRRKRLTFGSPRLARWSQVGVGLLLLAMPW
ncbi:hypothetical protein [Limosilactobacillus ingluviei]|mgnify:CR=1 FL=1|uniref:Uncharacterized protein n=1 Tax=Limosilactobacillus ingluviei TaxID=148604 RepID=A0A0R2H0P9_9LACO|nr:hypothetical protein [Limosilactobacillus ingluviei]KRN45158.1 hypothetical protein IV41_GL001563 [Limosilactobacillus ingluviei]MDO4603133.1 hypothetical protein [Limosilactobacillus ingluviei]HJG50185.1 hypothetical protein [Limosilactobacillus ingluviei]